MSARLGRLLNRLWLALAIPPVLALAIQLGTALGARPDPGLFAAPLQGAGAIPRRNGTSVGLARRGLPTAVIP